MKAVILAGGLGTRISEETHLKPKPMIEIGGKPILWHIMKYYSCFGINRFILALGYKGEVIKQYFLNYRQISSDFSIKLNPSTEINYLNKSSEKNWEINIRPTMQPIYFEQSNELVINHFDDKSDYLVVIDVLEGKILSKVNLRTPMANGMFLTPGFNNDVLYCSTLAISKVSW